MLSRVTHLIATSPLSNQTTGSFDLTRTKSRTSRVISEVVEKVWMCGGGGGFKNVGLECRNEDRSPSGSSSRICEQFGSFLGISARRVCTCVCRRSKKRKRCENKAI